MFKTLLSNVKDIFRKSFKQFDCLKYEQPYWFTKKVKSLSKNIFFLSESTEESSKEELERNLKDTKEKLEKIKRECQEELLSSYTDKAHKVSILDIIESKEIIIGNVANKRFQKEYYYRENSDDKDVYLYYFSDHEDKVCDGYFSLVSNNLIYFKEKMGILHNLWNNIFILYEKGNIKDAEKKLKMIYCLKRGILPFSYKDSNLGWGIRADQTGQIMIKNESSYFTQKRIEFDDFENIFDSIDGYLKSKEDSKGLLDSVDDSSQVNYTYKGENYVAEKKILPGKYFSGYYARNDKQNTIFIPSEREFILKIEQGQLPKLTLNDWEVIINPTIETLPFMSLIPYNIPYFICHKDHLDYTVWIFPFPLILYPNQEKKQIAYNGGNYEKHQEKHWVSFNVSKNMLTFEINETKYEILKKSYNQNGGTTLLRTILGINRGECPDRNQGYPHDNKLIPENYVKKSDEREESDQSEDTWEKVMDKIINGDNSVKDTSTKYLAQDNYSFQEGEFTSEKDLGTKEVLREDLKRNIKLLSSEEVKDLYKNCQTKIQEALKIFNYSEEYSEDKSDLVSQLGELLEETETSDKSKSNEEQIEPDKLKAIKNFIDKTKSCSPSSQKGVVIIPQLKKIKEELIAQRKSFTEQLKNNIVDTLGLPALNTTQIQLLINIIIINQLLSDILETIKLISEASPNCLKRNQIWLKKCNICIIDDEKNDLHYLYSSEGREKFKFLFQIYFGRIISKQQWEYFEQIIKKASHNTSYLHQIMMGKGKSSVIAPLLILHFYSQGQNPFLVVPEALKKQTITDHYQIKTYFDLNSFLDQKTKVYPSKDYILTDTELKREMLSNNLRLEYSVHKITNLEEEEFSKAVFNLTPPEINHIHEIDLITKFKEFLNPKLESKEEKYIDLFEKIETFLETNSTLKEIKDYVDLILCLDEGNQMSLSYHLEELLIVEQKLKSLEVMEIPNNKLEWVKKLISINIVDFKKGDQSEGVNDNNTPVGYDKAVSKINNMVAESKLDIELHKTLNELDMALLSLDNKKYTKDSEQPWLFQKILNAKNNSSSIISRVLQENNINMDNISDTTNILDSSKDSMLRKLLNESPMKPEQQPLIVEKKKNKINLIIGEFEKIKIGPLTRRRQPLNKKKNTESTVKKVVPSDEEIEKKIILAEQQIGVNTKTFWDWDLDPLLEEIYKSHNGDFIELEKNKESMFINLIGMGDTLLEKKDLLEIIIKKKIRAIQNIKKALKSLTENLKKISLEIYKTLNFDGVITKCKEFIKNKDFLTNLYKITKSELSYKEKEPILILLGSFDKVNKNIKILEQLDNIKNYNLNIRNKVLIFDEFDTMYDSLNSNYNEILLESQENLLDSTEIELILRYVFQKGMYKALLETDPELKPKTKKFLILLDKVLINIDSNIKNSTYGMSKIPENRDKRLVIPYQRKDSPKEGSNFSSDVITIALTMKYFLDTTDQIFEKEDIYNFMIKRPNEFLSILDGESHKWCTFNEFQVLKSNDNIISQLNIILEKIHNFKTRDIIETFIERDIKSLFKKDSLSDSTIYNLILLHIEIMNDIKETKIIKNISFLDIISERNIHFQCGFTGTVNLDLLDYSTVPDKSIKRFNQGSLLPDYDEKLNVYCAFNGTLDISKNKYFTINTFDDLIEKLRTSESPYHILIDAVGFLKDYKNVDVCQQIYNILTKKKDPSKDIVRVVYLDDKDNKVIYQGPKQEKIPYTGFLEDAFYYYSQRNIVGIDFRQPTEMRGILLVNQQLKYTDMAQAIYRARKLNNGHVMDICECKKTSETVKKVVVAAGTYDKLKKKKNPGTPSSIRSISKFWSWHTSIKKPFNRGRGPNEEDSFQEKKQKLYKQMLLNDEQNKEAKTKLLYSQAIKEISRSNYQITGDPEDPIFTKLESYTDEKEKKILEKIKDITYLETDLTPYYKLGTEEPELTSEVVPPRIISEKALRVRYFLNSRYDPQKFTYVHKQENYSELLESSFKVIKHYDVLEALDLGVNGSQCKNQQNIETEQEIQIEIEMQSQKNNHYQIGKDDLFFPQIFNPSQLHDDIKDETILLCTHEEDGLTHHLLASYNIFQPGELRGIRLLILKFTKVHLWILSNSIFCNRMLRLGVQMDLKTRGIYNRNLFHNVERDDYQNKIPDPFRYIFLTNPIFPPDSISKSYSEILEIIYKYYNTPLPQVEIEKGGASISALDEEKKKKIIERLEIGYYMRDIYGQINKDENGGSPFILFSTHDKYFQSNLDYYRGLIRSEYNEMEEAKGGGKRSILIKRKKTRKLIKKVKRTPKLINSVKTTRKQNLKVPKKSKRKN